MPETPRKPTIGMYTNNEQLEQDCRAIAVNVQGPLIDIALAERITESFVRLIEMREKRHEP